MESYHTIEKRKVGGKKQNVTVLHSRKKYVEVPFEQWEKLHYFDLKDYEAARDEYEGTDYDVHKNDRYHNVFDVIEKRYGINHPDRFWKKPKRVWLRVLWWYIYLSWQGTTEKTANVLADNSTDEILQLVDRCGRGGYRVELYRAIMRKYSQLDIQERRRSQIFRKMMVLNTARVQVVEPAFSCNGENGYVDELYNYFVEG